MSALEKVRDRRELPAPAARRAIRLSAGLSLADIGRELGVSGAAVHRWESGDRFPNAAHLHAYVELLRRIQAEMAA